MKKNEVLNEEMIEERCHDCGEPLPQGKGKVSFYARNMGLCLYCYRRKYQRRGRPKWHAISSGSDWFLSWTKRRCLEQKGFNPDVWSEEFRREMRDYWRARMRGEC